MDVHGQDLPFEEIRGVDPVSYEAFQAFRDAMLKYRQLLHSHFSEKGRHPGQAMALGMLAADEGISQRALAEKLHVSAPTITMMLKRLEKSGVIERRADEQDQRVTRIYLSGEGREVLGEVREAFAEVMKAGLGSMPEKDQRELARLLRRLAENMSQSLQSDCGGVSEATRTDKAE